MWVNHFKIMGKNDHFKMIVYFSLKDLNISKLSWIHKKLELISVGAFMGLIKQK